MASQNNLFDRAIERLYSAGIGECDWQSALSSVSESCCGVSATTFELDRATGRFISWDSFNLDPAGSSEYQARMNEINPRMQYSMRRPGVHIAWDYQFAGEAEMRKSEFYDWLAKQDLRYFVGGRIQDSGDKSIFSSVEFGLRQGHPDKTQISKFSRLSRHLANARAIANLRSNKPFAGVSEGLLLDRTSSAVFMIDGGGRIVFLNAAAGAMATAADLVSITDRRLNFRGKENQSNFERGLGALLNALALGETTPGTVLAMQQSPDEDQLIVRLIPMPRTVVAPNGSRTMAVVTVDGPPPIASSFGRELRLLYRLTRREAEIAQLLWKTGSVPGAANAMGISVNTGRVHLQRVFAKLGVRSQSELIKRFDQLLRWH